MVRRPKPKEEPEVCKKGDIACKTRQMRREQEERNKRMGRKFRKQY